MYERTIFNFRINCFNVFLKFLQDIILDGLRGTSCHNINTVMKWEQEMIQATSFFLKFLIFKLKFIMFITNTNTTENLFITVVGHNYHPLYIDDNITRLKLQFSTSYIFAIRCYKPLIFETLNSARSYFITIVQPA